MTRLLIFILVLLSAPTLMAGEPSADPVMQNSLSELKKEVIRLNRDLFVLKEQLLFPESSQVSIFIGLNGNAFFHLDSIRVKIDGRNVASHLYTDHEIRALLMGGLHRIYLANMKSGIHEAGLFITGQDKQGREIKRAITRVFEKGENEKFLKMEINENRTIQRPSFAIQEWE
ncbi:MAG: AraC family transcriptional regulator [Gammaproteobacteria bacterium]|nr:MAG: AraC family transcriptional regulator [Gammaproteobacteria bacterium]